MKVLLDHNLSRRLRVFLPGHLVRTAKQEGWSTLLNGELIHAAETSGFDVLLTADQKIVYQQNNQRRRIALVVLTSNRWSLVAPLGPEVLAAVERREIGSYEVVRVPLPDMSR